MEAKGDTGSNNFPYLTKYQKISFYSHSIMTLPTVILLLTVLIKKLAQMSAIGRKYKLQPDAKQGRESPAGLAEVTFPTSLTSFIPKAGSLFHIPFLIGLLSHINLSCTGTLESHRAC